MFDTGRVGFGKGTELWGSTSGSVTTAARTTSTVGFNTVLPMRWEDDGTFGGFTGRTIHAKGMKVIKLCELAFLPEWPSIEFLELSASETAECILFGSEMLGLEGMQEESDLFRGDSVGSRRRVSAKGMDRAKGVDIKEECINVSIIRVSMINEIEFSMHTLAGSLVR